MSTFHHQWVSRSSPRFQCHRLCHRQCNQEQLRCCFHAGSIPNHSRNLYQDHNPLRNASTSILDLSPYLEVARGRPLMELQMANQFRHLSHQSGYRHWKCHRYCHRYRFCHQKLERERHKLLSTGGYRYTPLSHSWWFRLRAGRCNISE